jgi:hypothetical protein
MSTRETDELIQQKLKEKKYKEAEKEKEKAEKEAKKKKQGQIVLYTFLGLAVAGALALILYLLLRDTWTYGCLGNGQCVVQRGNLSKNECERLCRTSDPADDMWTCTASGCRLAVGEERKDAVTLDDCERICRLQFTLRMVSPTSGYLSGPTRSAEGDCGMVPGRVTASDSSSGAVQVVFSDIGIREDPRQTYGVYSTRIREAGSDRYIKSIGSILVWSDDPNIPANTFILSHLEGSTRPVYTLGTTDSAGVYYSVGIEDDTGCPDRLLDRAPDPAQPPLWEIL